MYQKIPEEIKKEIEFIKNDVPNQYAIGDPKRTIAIESIMKIEQYIKGERL